ncbi:MAG: translocation/assembly module TamB domain-containing protein [Ginsengibacter sp.]
MQNDIQIKEINLDNMIVKVKRLLPDTVFNFQFLVNAFVSPTDTSKAADTSAIKMNIENIVVNNTRIVYKDIITGNDMDMSVKHLDVPIKTFDINHLYFDIPKFTVSGLKGHFYQNEPLQAKIVNAVAEATQQSSNYLQLKNDEISFQDIDFAYKNAVSDIGMVLKVNNMVAHPDTLDLKNGKFSFKDFNLDKSDITITMSNKPPPPVTLEQKKDEASLPPYTFTSNELKITGSNFKLNNTSMPVLNYGIDYGHLDVKDLNFSAADLFYNVDTLAAKIKSGSMKEKSGVVLNELNTDLLYTATGISLQDLYIKTPGTLLRNKAVITYPSLEQITTNPGLLGLDINLESSYVLVRDMLLFAPQLRVQPAFSHPNQTWSFNGRVFGHVNDLHFNDFRFKGFNNTAAFITGTLKGLPDPKKFQADLSIPYFTTTRNDIEGILPKGTLPANIQLPETISASGKLKTSMNDLVSDLTIKTSYGSAKLTGNVSNFANPKAARYNMAMNAYAINLGALMKDPKTYGILSGSFRAVGSGFDPNTAKAKINGIISSVGYNQYTYKNIKLDATIANKNYTVNTSVRDPNINLSVVASGAMNGKYPSLHLSADIDSIKTQPLHFTPQTVVYHGKIDGDFSNLDPDNLAGNLLVTNSILVNDGKRFAFDSLALIATNSGNTHTLSIRSDWASVTINGIYKLTQMADVFQQSIDPYFAMSATRNIAKVDPYNFSITGGIVENEALKAFMPGLKKLKPINLNAHFASDSGWNGFVTVPYVLYDTYLINDLKLSAATKNGALTFNTSIDQFKSDNSLALFVTTLDGSLQKNNLDFTLNTKDAKSVNKYTISGLLSQPSPNNYTFSLKPENLLLNYTKWSINTGNSIQYLNNDITANNFILSQGNQQLSINSVGSGTNKPLSIDFKNFSISTLTAFVQTDSLLVNGTLNGNTVVKNIQLQPVFTTDLTVSDLSIYKDTIGTLTAKVNNNVANTYNADVRLTGYGNEVTLLGNYFLKPENSSYDFTINVGSFQMKSIEGFTKGGIRDARGNLSGSIAINGTLDKPVVDGRINFNNTAFVASALGNLFKVDNEAIAIIKNEGIILNTFTIRDTANNAIIIDGAVNTADFFNYTFNLKIDADNFQAINSTKKDNHLFYGKMIFSTALTITGTPTQPVVTGDLTINDKTDFTVVLPQTEPGVVQREGIVRFVDYSAGAEDSLFMAPYDSLKTSPLIGYDISLNIYVDQNAVFNLIVDEGNGDFLRLKGVAQLTAGIDASGKITLVGSYEIAEGSYALSFNFIKRKFTIEKGSRIVWTGEPTTAQVSVTAIYIANTAPLDLVSGQVTENAILYRQKLPFEVHLIIKGELMQPEISFDVVLPTEGNYNVSTDIVSNVQTALTQLRQETGELNKQVFALLLLNRFVGQNPFDNSSGGGANAGSFAKESVSKLLTEQLNQLATGLIEGVDINFDVASTQDYTSGTQQQRTDFNVGLSKRLLNDRLTVTLGTGFELEGPRSTNQQQNNASPNIAVDYKLSKDGKYMLRAYRRNDYTGELDGYVIETGISFIISLDYNRFRQIFLTKSARAKKRQIKKENKQSDKEAQTDPPQTQAILPLNENSNEAQK